MIEKKSNNNKQAGVFSKEYFLIRGSIYDDTCIADN